MFSSGLLQGMLLHRHSGCGLCIDAPSRAQRARELAVRADGSGDTPALAGKPALRPPPKPAQRPPSGNGAGGGGGGAGMRSAQNRPRPSERVLNAKGLNRDRRPLREEQAPGTDTGDHANSNGMECPLVQSAALALATLLLSSDQLFCELDAGTGRPPQNGRAGVNGAASPPPGRRHAPPPPRQPMPAPRAAAAPPAAPAAPLPVRPAPEARAAPPPVRPQAMAPQAAAVRPAAPAVQRAAPAAPPAAPAAREARAQAPAERLSRPAEEPAQPTEPRVPSQGGLEPQVAEAGPSRPGVRPEPANAGEPSVAESGPAEVLAAKPTVRLAQPPARPLARPAAGPVQRLGQQLPDAEGGAWDSSGRPNGVNRPPPRRAPAPPRPAVVPIREGAVAPTRDSLTCVSHCPSCFLVHCTLVRTFLTCGGTLAGPCCIDSCIDIYACLSSAGCVVRCSENS